MREGRLITFEGIEGSGKTTQLLKLADYLRGRGTPVLTTREPGGTSVGERVRAILLDPALKPVPLAELFLLEAARAQLVAEIIQPALAAGTFVLSDRFADSSLSYQAGARRVALAVVEQLNALACVGVIPDRTVVLDLDVELAVARARQRPETTAGNRRFEDEAMAFHRAVAEAYRALAARAAPRVVLVDGSGAPTDVHARVLAAVRDMLP